MASKPQKICPHQEHHLLDPPNNFQLPLELKYFCSKTPPLHSRVD